MWPSPNKLNSVNAKAEGGWFSLKRFGKGGAGTCSLVGKGAMTGIGDSVTTGCTIFSEDSVTTGDSDTASDSDITGGSDATGGSVTTDDSDIRGDSVSRGRAVTTGGSVSTGRGVTTGHSDSNEDTVSCGSSVSTGPTVSTGLVVTVDPSVTTGSTDSIVPKVITGTSDAPSVPISTGPKVNTGASVAEGVSSTNVSLSMVITEKVDIEDTSLRMEMIEIDSETDEMDSGAGGVTSTTVGLDNGADELGVKVDELDSIMDEVESRPGVVDCSMVELDGGIDRLSAGVDELDGRTGGVTIKTDEVETTTDGPDNPMGRLVRPGGVAIGLGRIGNGRPWLFICRFFFFLSSPSNSSSLSSAKYGPKGSAGLSGSPKSVFPPTVPRSSALMLRSTLRPDAWQRCTSVPRAVQFSRPGA